MDKAFIAEISRIIGVSEDSITAMDEEIQNSMQAVFEMTEIKGDDDKKLLYDALDELWQKGSVLVKLHEVADGTGIPFVTLKNLPYDIQQTVVFDFLNDSTDISHIYDVVNKALAVSEIPDVAKLLSVPARELRELPRDIQEEICGHYAMEYEHGEPNAELIAQLRELISP